MNIDTLLSSVRVQFTAGSNVRLVRYSLCPKYDPFKDIDLIKEARELLIKVDGFSLVEADILLNTEFSKVYELFLPTGLPKEAFKDLWQHTLNNNRECRADTRTESISRILRYRRINLNEEAKIKFLETYEEEGLARCFDIAWWIFGDAITDLKTGFQVKSINGKIAGQVLDALGVDKTDC